VKNFTGIKGTDILSGREFAENTAIEPLEVLVVR